MDTTAPAPRFSALRAVHTPRHLRTLGRVIAAFLLSLPFVLALTPWQQTAIGTGKVVAFDPLDRQQSIEAPVEGRVAKWHVAEGATVRKGDLIAEIVDNDAELVDRLDDEKMATLSKIEAAAAQVAINGERVASLEEARDLAIEAAEQRVQMAEQRITAAEQRETGATAAAETAHLNRDRQKKLLTDGLASDRAVELADLEVQRTETEREQAKANLSAARSEVLSLRAERLRIEADADANIDSTRANIEIATEKEATAIGELARIEVRVARQHAQVVRAPRDGRVLRLSASQGGDMVKAGDTLALLVPDSAANAVEVYVDGNDLPLIHEGQPVRLQFEGWPALQFSGWPAVAVGTFGGTVQVVDASDGGTGKFRLIVVPDKAEDPWPDQRWLRQGVRANGWVMLGEVSLGWELWRQFNGFPPLAPPEAKSGDPKGPAAVGKKK